MNSVKQLPEIDDFRGTIQNEYDDFRNRIRRSSTPGKTGPTGLADIQGILNYLYPTEVYNNFAGRTISTVDDKIIYDNEIIKYISI